MLVSVFYRNKCAKSQFLRIAIREMFWEFHEYNVDDPDSKEKLIQLKKGLGSGFEPITPAIQTKEAYSHELFGIIEYLYECNPTGSMYSDQPSTRLVSRTILYRVFRELTPIWERYQTSGSPDELVAYFRKSVPLIEAVIQGVKAYRSNIEIPCYVDILLAILTLEANRHIPIPNKEIRDWISTMSNRKSFAELIPEFQEE